jgi:hypothetical protein
MEIDQEFSQNPQNMKSKKTFATGVVAHEF